MGFFIRKSFGGKHLKFNLSKSGIGTSFGIKGLRFGIDGKGKTYISGGKGMFRFRECIKNNNAIPFKDAKLKTSNKGCIGCLCIFIIVMTIGYNSNIGFTLLGVYLIYLLISFFKKIKFYILENNLTNCEIDEMPKIIEYLIKKCPDKEKEYKLFLIEKYKENKMYNEALEILEQNYLGETRQLKMQILEKLERYEDIVSIIQKEFTEEEKKEHPAIYAFLAEAFLKMNKPDAAIEVLLQGPINATKMTEEMCAFRYALGECYETKGDNKNALKQYNKVYAYNMNFEDISNKIKKLG